MKNIHTLSFSFPYDVQKNVHFFKSMLRSEYILQHLLRKYMNHKILSAFAFISFITIQSSASEGPLKIGNFNPFVSSVAAKKINECFIRNATRLNKGIMLSGSIANMCMDIVSQTPDLYYATHQAQLTASADYIHAANSNSKVQEIVTLIETHKDAPLQKRIELWDLYYLAAHTAFSAIVHKAIPKLDLSSNNVVGLIYLNQDLTFDELETISFGGAVAAEISIMQFFFESDLEAFTAFFRAYLPAAEKKAK